MRTESQLRRLGEEAVEVSLSPENTWLNVGCTRSGVADRAGRGTGKYGAENVLRRSSPMFTPAKWRREVRRACEMREVREVQDVRDVREMREGGRSCASGGHGGRGGRAGAAAFFAAETVLNSHSEQASSGDGVFERP